jgi:hypothetical protein
LMVTSAAEPIALRMFHCRTISVCLFSGVATSCVA